MSRIRTIKPEFFKHEELFDGETETGLPLRLAFAGLWTQCDREGRFTWRPRQLKVDIVPYDEIDFSRVLDALAARGFVVKYTVDGRDFGYVPSWSRHQVINNRETASCLPDPSETIAYSNASSTRAARVAHAGKAEGKGREGKGREDSLSETSSDNPPKPKKKTTYSDAFEAFWKAYPRTPNMSKLEAFQAWQKIDDNDRALAQAAIAPFKAFLRTKPDLEIQHACRFISKRRFEGFATDNRSLPDEQWQKRLTYGRREAKWSTKDWGPIPGQPGSIVPHHLLQQGDGEGWREPELAA